MKDIELIIEEGKERGIFLVGQGNVGKSVAHYLAEKGHDAILVDGSEIDRNSFEVNGVKYTPIPSEKSKGRLSTAAINAIAMAEMFSAIGNMAYGDKYERTLPKSVNIVKEYGLIQLKQSKLSKWEREQVVKVFEYNFKKV